MPDYPTPVRPVTASLRDAAGAWPAAVWLALAAVVAIEGGGGASSGGIALGAAVCLGALRPRRRRHGRRRLRADACRRAGCSVYVGALALTALASYASIALVADAADVLWRRQPLARGRGRRGRAAPCSPACSAVRSRAPCGCSAPPRCRSSPTRSSNARTACSSRPRRGCRACSAIPNAIGAYAALAAPAALWLASSPQRARRVAGCGTLALLVLGLALASSRGGMLAAVIGCAAWFARQRPAHRGRRGRAGGARRDASRSLAGASTCAPSRRSTRPSPCPPATAWSGTRRRRCVAAAIARPARRRARAARGRARAPHLRPGRRWRCS